METDKDPTFAEALLACAFHVNSGVYRTELDCLERARNTVRTAPPAIRRALGADAPGGNSDRVRGCEDTLNRHAQWITKNEVAISELKKAALGVDKPQVVEPRELSLEKQLAAAVARAEKSEEQMRHDSDARRLAEAGRVSAVEAMCASERELDALRAELEEAMVSRSGLEAYSRQMAKDRDKWNAQCAAAEIECAKLRSERDSLRAELDKAKAEADHD